MMALLKARLTWKLNIRRSFINTKPLGYCTDIRLVIASGEEVGQITSSAWSPDFETNVAIGMIQMNYWDDGSRAKVETAAGLRTAIVKGNSLI